MRVRAGYIIAFETFGPTPMNLLLNVRPEREQDLISPMVIKLDPPVPVVQHLDSFGNLVSRITAPGGRITISADFLINDTGRHDDSTVGSQEVPVDVLPSDVLPFLLVKGR